MSRREEESKRHSFPANLS